MAPSLDFEDQIPRRSRTEEGETRSPLLGQEHVPACGKASGRESQGPHHDTVLRQDAPRSPPASLQTGQGLGTMAATPLRNGGRLKAVRVPGKHTRDGSSVPLRAGAGAPHKGSDSRLDPHPWGGCSSLGRGPPDGRTVSRGNKTVTTSQIDCVCGLLSKNKFVGYYWYCSLFL